LKCNMRLILLLLCSLTVSVWSSSLQHAHAHPRTGRLQGQSDQNGHGRSQQHGHGLPRQAKRVTLNRDGRQIEVQGGVDFSTAELDPSTGLMCVFKEIEVDSLEKEPILECTHQNVEKCHYTYITQFKPTQEQICTENFNKRCQITFKQQALNETVQKCYKPLEKVCNGEGEEICKTVFESSCTTKYVEKQPGKFVGDSQCEKLPIKVCGKGCTYEEGEEECHDKVLTSVVEIPEEVCDLNPEKICRFTTKLVPKLVPQHQCTIVPKQACHLKFSNPVPSKKPLMTKWCLDPTEPAPGESYDESNAIGAPLGPSGDVGRTETGTSGPGSPGAPAPGPSGSQDVPSVDPVPSQTPVPTGGLDVANGGQEDFTVVDPDLYEASTFSPESSFPENIQPPEDEDYYDNIPDSNNPYDVTYDDYNTVIDNIAPGDNAPTSGYDGDVTQDTIEQANQFSPAPAPVDPIQAPVDPTFAPVDQITPGVFTPADSLATPRTPELLEPAVQADTFYGAPPVESQSDFLSDEVPALPSPSQVTVDEMLPPAAKAPMSFYGAPVEEAEAAAAANAEAAIEEILEVPAEEAQTFYGAPRQGRVLAFQRNQPRRNQQQPRSRRPQPQQQRRGFQPRPHRGPRRNLGLRG